jgi:hypothetical protein
MQKVKLSERALLARINRALAKEDEGLRRCREDSRDFHNLGRYYRVDYFHNGIVGTDVDLESLGRELKVLADWEVLDPQE